MSEADIDVRGVSKRYGDAVAVDDVSFSVERGHVLSLLGPSGCGKTTTMRMIAGLVDPTAGSIFVKGKSVAGLPVHKRNIGMLFQSYALFPHLDVASNVAFGLKMRRLAKAEIARRVADALAMVKLGHLAERMPHQLSGGQQQRVALARALVIEPAVLLLDEPLGALDKKLREGMQIELSQLQRRLGLTTLMVTHDQDEALTLSDRIAVMRDGRIEQIGTPGEIYDRPASLFVAGFIGSSNVFRCRVAARDGSGCLVEDTAGVRLTLPGGPAEGADVVVALRPEYIRLAPGTAVEGPNQMATEVEQVIYRGQYTQFLLRRDGGETMIAIRQGSEAEGQTAMDGIGPGSAVVASWDERHNRVVRDDP
jgi:ABC-type branched-subunit amino acid transport system ATPase component